MIAYVYKGHEIQLKLIWNFILAYINFITFLILYY